MPIATASDRLPRRSRSVLVAPGEEQSGFSFSRRSNIRTGFTASTPIPASSSTSVRVEMDMGAGIGVGTGGWKAAKRKPWRRCDPFPGPLHGSHDLAPAPLHRDAAAEDATGPGGHSQEKSYYQVEGGNHPQMQGQKSFPGSEGGGGSQSPQRSTEDTKGHSVLVFSTCLRSRHDSPFPQEVWLDRV